jgi:hypothetical protein
MRILNTLSRRNTNHDDHPLTVRSSMSFKASDIESQIAHQNHLAATQQDLKLSAFLHHAVPKDCTFDYRLNSNNSNQTSKVIKRKIRYSLGRILSSREITSPFINQALSF